LGADLCVPDVWLSAYRPGPATRVWAARNVTAFGPLPLRAGRVGRFQSADSRSSRRMAWRTC
jgi:hypothetical protein